MKLITTSLFFIVFSSCSHGYFYRPEVAGEGTLAAGRGVTYSIPPLLPEVKMHLTSMGVTSPPSSMQPAYAGHMLQVRALMMRTPQAGPNAHAYVEAGEQIVTLPGGDTIKPTFAHATVSKKSQLALDGKQTRHGIDLFFPLPAGITKEGDMERFTLTWVVHFGHDQVEKHTVRFDRFDSSPQTGGAGDVEEFGGFGGAPGFAPGADGGLNGWSWWGV